MTMVMTMIMMTTLMLRDDGRGWAREKETEVCLLMVVSAMALITVRLKVEGPGCAQKRMMHDNVDDDDDGKRRRLSRDVTTTVLSPDP